MPTWCAAGSCGARVAYAQGRGGLPALGRAVRKVAPGRGRCCRGMGHWGSSSRRCTDALRRSGSDGPLRSPRPGPSVTHHFTVARFLHVAPRGVHVSRQAGDVDVQDSGGSGAQLTGPRIERYDLRRDGARLRVPSSPSASVHRGGPEGAPPRRGAAMSPMTERAAPQERESHLPYVAGPWTTPRRALPPGSSGQCDPITRWRGRVPSRGPRRGPLAL
jgi:hypothetical protein